jgi:hypothetical protein
MHPDDRNSVKMSCRQKSMSSRFPVICRRLTASLQLPPTESVTSRVKIRATVKQGGQSDHMVRNATSNMTQVELSIIKVTWLGTRIQFVDSKQATPTAFDPFPPAGVPTTTSAITAICRPPPFWTHSLKIKHLLVIYSIPRLSRLCLSHQSA